MPPRVCNPPCDVPRGAITITLHRPCEACLTNDNGDYSEIRRVIEARRTVDFRDKPLPGIPMLGPIEGHPPRYTQAIETPPKYARASAKEQPVAYDCVMAAVANFHPEEIVMAWHMLRATQMRLLPPLTLELEALQRRVGKAKRRLHRPEDIGFCEEVNMRLTRELDILDKNILWGQRYLDATLVLKYGLYKCQFAAMEAVKAGNHDQARLQVKAASEHADRLLEMKIQLSRPKQQPRQLELCIKLQIRILETVVQTLEARTTSRILAFMQVAARSDYEVHC
ncbi:hypothetical protein E4T38_08200 [Aureobasidium subglaciale]|nr:hypothetical protein E4T38_08200 [Aureobasidium subglaciale]KAI5215752.1 hypothetical protein E4T40_08210 [Aureobasidium subglaciale]KAI5219026.1 hypothetical protein E4T41_08125 [Aureobasidium subglaciale]KAI5256617.1 hypothetical protein E4T46_08101 [Aureobasidium subglaciale]